MAGDAATSAGGIVTFSFLEHIVTALTVGGDRGDCDITRPIKSVTTSRCASSPVHQRPQDNGVKPTFEKTRGCFNMAPSDGRSIMLPQEIIDLILEFTDETTLKLAKLASILSMFVNLTKLSIDSQTMLEWNSDVLAAFRDTITLSTLTSVRIGHSTFDRSSQLVSLLQSSRSLEFLALVRVRVERIDMIKVDAASRLRLRSLEIDQNPPLMHSVTSVVDPQCLRYLRITALFFKDLHSNTVQCLLDNASHLNHCHFYCAEICFGRNISAYSFRSHLHLRTLEFSVTDYWTPEMYDWAVGILSGVPNPSPVQHVILNVRVHLDMPWRSNFIGYLTHLQLVLTAPPVAPLRRVTVRLNSYDGSHIGVGIEQEIRDALPVLRDRGLLEVVLLERN
ncbi:hypothetical protein GGX14DRAFT_654263 [Mycena pura]|uniref:F-box domain-containing protein n=1 Tax=Mycena pura TaxID=153505 RepID=A0AAD6V812_9AGAR|nr:hypothetical protein GGX14DRAFT_654263 [Mycena pura]